jgi:hypothetical protein
MDATASYILRYNAGRGEHYHTLFPRLQSELKKHNFDLDFIILDTSTEHSFGLQHPGLMEYPQILELESFIQEDLGIKFGINLVSFEGGNTSEKMFYDRCLEFAKEYKKRGGNPDYYFSETWYRYPWRVLPENSPDPQYSQTKVFLDVSKIVAKEKSQSPVFAPEDINNDSIVDINDIKEIMRDFGKTDSFINQKNDVNKDGIVNLKDVALVAKVT